MARVRSGRKAAATGRVFEAPYTATVVDAGSPAALRMVKLARGQPGNVESAMPRSPVGYRAVFEGRGGRWLMATFLAGD